MKVIVKRNNLTYRTRGFNKDKPFIPEIGDALELSPSIVKLEVKTGNVRLPLEEEEDKIAVNSTKKKKKKVKNG
jgi:hypothetical protein